MNHCGRRAFIRMPQHTVITFRHRFPSSTLPQIPPALEEPPVKYKTWCGHPSKASSPTFQEDITYLWNLLHATLFEKMSENVGPWPNLTTNESIHLQTPPPRRSFCGPASAFPSHPPRVPSTNTKDFPSHYNLVPTEQPFLPVSPCPTPTPHLHSL